MKTTTIKKQTALRLVPIEPVQSSSVETKKYDLSHVTDPELKAILDCFLNTNETRKQFKKFFVDGNGLYYRTTDTRLHIPKLVEHVIALKIVQGDRTVIIGNSSVLPFLEARSKTRLNTGQTQVQRALSTILPMIPFSVFEQAKLNPESLEIVECGPQETVRVRSNNPKYKSWEDDCKEPQYIFTPRHYTGASLFRIKREYFLFDIDRREIEHGIFNAFLVNLSRPAKTIKEAYETLKPNAVKRAEQMGLEVPRQGEWFFLPVSQEKQKELNALVPDTDSLESITLSAGPNRPNYAQGVELKDGKVLKRRDLEWEARRRVKSDELYVTGAVTHSGREHEDLNLKGWYTAVPNTATKSFTITGDVD